MGFRAALNDQGGLVLYAALYDNYPSIEKASRTLPESNRKVNALTAITLIVRVKSPVASHLFVAEKRTQMVKAERLCTGKDINAGPSSRVLQVQSV